MNIRVSQIPATGSVSEFSLSPELLTASLDQSDRLYPLISSPTQTTVHATRVLHAVRLKGHIKLPLTPECDRCLSCYAFVYETDFDVTCLQAQESEEGDADLYYYSGDQIDLEKIACSQFYLNFPVSFRCQEICKGLCAICGQDLNVNACEHADVGVSLG